MFAHRSIFTLAVVQKVYNCPYRHVPKCTKLVVHVGLCDTSHTVRISLHTCHIYHRSYCILYKTIFTHVIFRQVVYSTRLILNVAYFDVHVDMSHTIPRLVFYICTLTSFITTHSYCTRVDEPTSHTLPLWHLSKSKPFVQKEYLWEVWPFWLLSLCIILLHACPTSQVSNCIIYHCKRVHDVTSNFIFWYCTCGHIDTCLTAPILMLHGSHCANYYCTIVQVDPCHTVPFFTCVHVEKCRTVAIFIVNVSMSAPDVLYKFLLWTYPSWLVSFCSSFYCTGGHVDTCGTVQILILYMSSIPPIALSKISLDTSWPGTMHFFCLRTGARLSVLLYALMFSAHVP